MTIIAEQIAFTADPQDTAGILKDTPNNAAELRIRIEINDERSLL